MEDLKRLTGMEQPSIASVISRLRASKGYEIHTKREKGSTALYTLVDLEGARQEPKFFTSDYIPCRFCNELVGPGKSHNPTCIALRRVRHG